MLSGVYKHKYQQAASVIAAEFATRRRALGHQAHAERINPKPDWPVCAKLVAGGDRGTDYAEHPVAHAEPRNRQGNSA